ncbi:MAG: ABC transporter permease subunit [Actinomycetota bacterium]|nr:ABC transporter permease subunit [Actinomycetota bacterium]
MIGDTTTAATAVAPAAATLAGGGGGAARGAGLLRARRRRRGLRALPVLPFAAYLGVFLVVPAIAVVVGAFESPAGRPTLANLHIAATGTYRQGFVTSLELSLITSLVPAAVGAVVAYAIHVGRPTSLLRRVTVTAAGVFSQFGGVPLAFLFIASLGTTGLATNWLADVGIHLDALGFNLYSMSGVAVVYPYFQIPLMVLVLLPGLEALRPDWREAASNLGASSRQYWRYVAAPALAPAFLGATLLLFGFAFAAYATADALTSGSLPLTAIQIGSFLNGNVIAGQQNVGNALALGMLVVVGAVMALYLVLQRRASRWLR